jgi:hypothetical protein
LEAVNICFRIKIRHFGSFVGKFSTNRPQKRRQEEEEAEEEEEWTQQKEAQTASPAV